jgi:Kef-type K+ transport system membrane component KefB
VRSPRCEGGLAVDEQAAQATSTWAVRAGRVAGGVAVVLGLVATVAWQLTRQSNVHDVEPLGRFFVAAAAVLLACHLLGAVASRFGQPRVVGEILGGLLLGPSALGLVWPAAPGWLFPGSVLGPLSTSAELGLVVFMFLLGCELRMDTARSRPRAVAMVAAGGMGLPFALGLVVAFPAGQLVAGPTGQPAAIFFLALALSITAMPVLARLLVDLGIDRTEAGRLSLATAAVGDGAAWAVLTVILAVATAEGSGILVALAAAAGFLAVTLLVVRPLLAVYVARLESGDRIDILLPTLVALAVGFAAVAQIIGLHPFIGAFLFGTVVPSESVVVRQLNRQLRGFTTVVLLPLFFASIGLTTSIGLIGADLSHWLLFGAVLAVAMISKLAGAAAGARLAGWRGREVFVIGALLNCRGVTELVVASIGRQYDLINDLGYTVLVLMALITTAVTSPLVRLITRGDPAVAAGGIRPTLGRAAPDG